MDCETKADAGLEVADPPSHGIIEQTCWVKAAQERLDEETVKNGVDLGRRPREPCRIPNVPRIFISYVHEDLVVAEALQRLLRNELALGNEIFLAADETHILAGDVWLDKIRAAIRSSKIMLLLLSGRSFGRSWVHFEAGAAWLNRSRSVVPLCIGRMKKGTLPHPYSGMQTLQLPEDARYLVSSIKEKLVVKRVSDDPRLMLVRTVAMAVDSYVRDPGQLRMREMEELLDPYLAFQRALESWTDEKPR